MRWIRYMVLFLLLGGSPGMALAAEPVSAVLPAHLATAKSQELAAAEQAVTAAREQVANLAQQITALKKNAEKSGRLQKLLQESLVAEERLRERLEQRLRLLSGVKVETEQRVTQLDAKIRRLVPRLKVGEMSDRRRAALALQKLRADRQALIEFYAAHQGTAGTAALWANMQVDIDPLDGPEELFEKADLVEDARDKLRQRREALAMLVADAQQSQRIARVEREFRADVGLFDETTRLGRVKRGEGASSLLPANQVATSNDSRAHNEPAAPVQGAPAIPTSDADPQTDAVDDFAAAPEAAPPNQPTSGGADVPAVVAPTISAPNLDRIVRELGPIVEGRFSLGMPVSGELDVARLETMLKELEVLDRELASQAEVIRQRANDIERAESND